MTHTPLTSLEIATGMALPILDGQDERGNEIHSAFDHAEPGGARTALERTILPGLLRPPCLVSFSGGRDSAAVLAVATSLARKEGLPLPIPATNTFPRVPATNEAAWQEQLVRRLELPDWIRVEHDDELDLIGPYARRVMEAHGLVWPANVHFHLPLLERAMGGSMLTGFGGDELYGAARWLHAEAVLARAVRPRPRDVLCVGLALAPHSVRRAVIRRRGMLELPWLKPRARALATALLVRETSEEPRRLHERMSWWLQARYLRVARNSLDLIAKDQAVQLVHPLLSTRFWCAVADEAGPLGFTSRAEGVRRLFGDVLPSEVIERRLKANFDGAFFTERALAFGRRWRGFGVPEQWVDPVVLARHWSGDRLSAQSGTLLQAAWLESETSRRRVEQTGECVV